MSGDDHTGPIAPFGPTFLECAGDRLVVVPVDREGVPSESTETLCIPVDIEAVHGSLALAHAVNVDDGIQVVHPVITRQRGRLPHRALGALTVSHQYIRVVRRSVHPRSQRHAQRGRQPLSQGSRRDADPWDPRRRVAFQVAVKLAERHRGGLIDYSCLGVRCVQQRCRVAFRQHEPVVRRVVRLLRVVAHLLEEYDRSQVGGRQAGGRVAGAGLRRRLDGEDAHAACLFFEDFDGCIHDLERFSFSSG